VGSYRNAEKSGRGGARSTPAEDGAGPDADAACLCRWCLRAAAAAANVDGPGAANDDDDEDAKPPTGGGGRSSPPKAREEAPNPEKRSWAMCVGHVPLASMLALRARGGWGVDKIKKR
jgi:hypothetical protein